MQLYVHDKSTTVCRQIFCRKLGPLKRSPTKWPLPNGTRTRAALIGSGNVCAEAQQPEWLSIFAEILALVSTDRAGVVRI